MVKVVLEKGVNVNVKNKKKETALHTVFCLEKSEKEVVEVVKLLVGKGSDLGARDEEALTPLASGLSYEPIKWEALVVLIDSLKDVPDNVLSVSNSPINVLSRSRSASFSSSSPRLSLKADRGSYGRSCLTLALRDLKREIVLKALNKGAHVFESKHTQHQKSPLFIATLNNWDDVVEKLLKRGANVKEKDPLTGDTPLHLSSKLGFERITNLLLSHKDSREVWMEAYIYSPPPTNKSPIPAFRTSSAVESGEEEKGEERERRKSEGGARGKALRIGIRGREDFYSVFRKEKMEDLVSKIQVVNVDQCYQLISTAIKRKDLHLLRLLLQSDKMTTTWKFLDKNSPHYNSSFKSTSSPSRRFSLSLRKKGKEEEERKEEERKKEEKKEEEGEVNELNKVEEKPSYWSMVVEEDPSGEVLELFLEEDGKANKKKGKRSNLITFDYKTLQLCFEKGDYVSFEKLWKHQTQMSKDLSFKIFLEKTKRGKLFFSEFCITFPEGDVKREVFELMCNRSKVDELKNTSLHLLCEEGNLQLVESLLLQPTKWKLSKNKQGKSPLHMACSPLHMNCSQIAPPLREEKELERIELERVELERVELIKRLVEVGKMDCNAQDKNGDTPLILLSKLPPSLFASKATAFLIEKGADASLSNNQGFSISPAVLHSLLSFTPSSSSPSSSSPLFPSLLFPPLQEEEEKMKRKENIEIKKEETPFLFHQSNTPSSHPRDVLDREGLEQVSSIAFCLQNQLDVPSTTSIRSIHTTNHSITQTIPPPTSTSTSTSTSISTPTSTSTSTSTPTDSFTLPQKSFK